MMGTAAWPSALCLLTLLQPATQDMVQLRAAPVLHAECGTDVSLKCEVSSPKQGLSVKYLGWSLNAAPLCFLTENSPINQSESLRRFHCMYSHGHLSLVLHNAQPRDGGNYACKLRSNKGTAHAATRVEFKEPNNCKDSSTSVSSQTSGITQNHTRLDLGSHKNGVGSFRPIKILSWGISLLFVVIQT